MTPEDLEVITDLFEGLNNVESPSGSNGLIFTILASIPTFLLIGRQLKKAFVKAIKDVLKTHTEEMKEIIEDLDGVKKNHEDLQKKVEDNHESILDKLKHTCSPPDVAEG